MNDEIEAAERTVWSQLVEVWIPRVAGIAMVLAMVRIFLCVPDDAKEPDDLAGPHCADEKGNATCVEHYGGAQPYCDRSTTIFHRCISEPPPPQYAAPCGQLEEGLPGDPDCSKIIADNPPDPDEVRAVREQSELSDMIRTILALGFFFGMTIWIYGRMIIRNRARAKREQRTAELGAIMGPQPNETLPAIHPRTESNKSQNEER